ncbi:ribose-phosphate pyrophosphokinase [candidate division BRC1 bacterium SM23_51]|nr:MAG: ribose-phosphate pyrophosphokinase [candidate division BRC1 bacterium SM23_51]
MANPALAQSICDALGVPLGACDTARFSDGETRVKINRNIRGADVYIVQPTCPPVNEHLTELLFLIDACRRASADRINAVIPYYGYGRQDRKDEGRVALSAKLVANLITTAGADRVITLDLHTGQIQGFFDIPVDHLLAQPILVDYISKHIGLDGAVVVSADVGRVKRARDFAERLHLPIAIVDKRRPAANVSEVVHIIGDVRDRVAIIFDDIIDTAGTVCHAANAVSRHGAQRVFACCTHAVFSGGARQRLADAAIEKIIVTDTIPQNDAGPLKNLVVCSVAPLIADAISRIHTHRSVSEMFD